MSDILLSVFLCAGISFIIGSNDRIHRKLGAIIVVISLILIVIFKWD